MQPRLFSCAYLSITPTFLFNANLRKEIFNHERGRQANILPVNMCPYIYTDIHITRAQANYKESLVRSGSEL